MYVYNYIYVLYMNSSTSMMFSPFYRNSILDISANIDYAKHQQTWFEWLQCSIREASDQLADNARSTSATNGHEKILEEFQCQQKIIHHIGSLMFIPIDLYRTIQSSPSQKMVLLFKVLICLD